MDKDKIKNIRTFLLPNFLGVEKISQKRFGMILSKTAKATTGVDFSIAKRTVEDWEYGNNNPSSVPLHILETIDKSIGKVKVCKNKQVLPYYEDVFVSEYLEWMVAKLVELIQESKREITV